MAQATIDTTVTGLQGTPVDATPPTVGQALVFNGTSWVPSASINGPLAVAGNLTVGTIVGPTSITGGLTSTGALAVGAGLTVTGAATIGAGLTVTGNVSSSGIVSGVTTVRAIMPNSTGNANFQMYDPSNTVQQGAVYFAGADGSVIINNFVTGSSVTVGGNVMGTGMSTSGQITSGTGFQCRAGTSGALYGNNFNIGWAGGSTAQLWIDNVNQGNISISCDYRLKKDIMELPSMWGRVKELRPIKYTQREYTPPASKSAAPMYSADDTECWGFVAHELQEALTFSAATGKKDQPDVVQSPNMLVIVAALTRALQEAMGRIEALEAR